MNIGEFLETNIEIKICSITKTDELCQKINDLLKEEMKNNIGTETRMNVDRIYHKGYDISKIKVYE